MLAALMYRAGDVRVQNVPDARLIESTDALITVTRACICGSDLWPYKLLEPVSPGRRMGHEAIGVVEAIGRDVHRVKVGQLVVTPFAYCDGTCDFCNDGLPTSCVHGGFFGTADKADGAQAEALRIPQADGTLFPLPVGRDDALMPSLLTLSDVMGTGHHAAISARVRRGKTAAARARERRYVLSDGQGMSLQVMPWGTKWWRFRYRFHRKEKMISLGVYPRVNLANARLSRDDARGLLARGIDPSADRKERRAANVRAFEAVARDWLKCLEVPVAKGRVTADTLKDATRILERHVFPELGARPIGVSVAFSNLPRSVIGRASPIPDDSENCSMRSMATQGAKSSASP